MFGENTATRESTTPSAAMAKSSFVGRMIPSRYVMTKRAIRKTIRLACRYHPAVSSETPTTSMAYWMVNDHAQTCAPTLRNCATTPKR